MNSNYYEDYLMITRGLRNPVYQYTTPEEQGAAIKKCTILEGVDIGYSTETITMDHSENEQRD